MSTELKEQPEEKSLSFNVFSYLKTSELIQAVTEAVPEGVNPERLLKSIAVCFAKNPKLKQSTKDSIRESVMKLAYTGLFPDGRVAHLIPYTNRKAGTIECQCQIDYKGYVELAYRSKQVLSIHADVIYEGDEFDYDLGQIRKHIPYSWRKDAKPQSKGKLLGAYCIVKMVDAEKHEVMDLDTVNEIRNRSQSPNSGPWVTDFNEMAKKSAFRRASKWIPITPEVARAVTDDDYEPILQPKVVTFDALTGEIDADPLGG